MSDQIRVELKGSPERVQQIADAMEVGLPGEITWDETAAAYPGGLIMLSGRGGLPSADTMLPTAA